MCTKQGLLAFLLVGQLLLISACVVFTSLSCFLLSMRTAKPALRHTHPTGVAPGVAVCNQGQAHVHVQNRHAHMSVQTAFGWKISWIFVFVCFSPLNGRKEKEL